VKIDRFSAVKLSFKYFFVWLEL